MHVKPTNNNDGFEFYDQKWKCKNTATNERRTWPHPHYHFVASSKASTKSIWKYFITGYVVLWCSINGGRTLVCIVKYGSGIDTYVGRQQQHKIVGKFFKELCRFGSNEKSHKIILKFSSSRMKNKIDGSCVVGFWADVVLNVKPEHYPCTGRCFQQWQRPRSA